MRKLQKFSFIFGIVNLLFGLLSSLSPFVSTRRRGVARFLPHRSQGLINRRPGRLFNLFAVSPTHAAMHSALGAAGLATRPLDGFSRPYLWLSALLFGALAVMGWTGQRLGSRALLGGRADWRDNVLHTVFAAAPLLLALRSGLSRRKAIDRGLDLTSTGLDD